MFAGPSTQIFHSYNEDKNGSIIASEKAEHAHSISRKFWFHGTHAILSFTHSLFYFSFN
jgi:hypothetical protein